MPIKYKKNIFKPINFVLNYKYNTNTLYYNINIPMLQNITTRPHIKGFESFYRTQSFV